MIFEAMFLLLFIAAVVGGCLLLVAAVNRKKEGQSLVDALGGFIRTAMGWAAASWTLRAGVLGLVALVMLIPLFAVEDVIQERLHYADGVDREIAGMWGGTQMIAGPLLVVPYEDSWVEERKVTRPAVDAGEGTWEEVVVEEKSLLRLGVFLPQNLDVIGEMTPQWRYRGLYQRLVYSSDLTFDGRFAAPDFSSFSLRPDATRTLHWDEARLVVSVSNPLGLTQGVSLTLDGATLEGEPGPGVSYLVSRGFHIDLNRAQVERGFHFTMPLATRGSDQLSLVPIGDTNTITLSGDWPHPGFGGAYLPLDFAVSAQDFSATWSVPALARNMPRLWTMPLDGDGGISFQAEANNLAIAVELADPFNFYTAIDRTTKYGLLFIGLTFATYFLLEMVMGLRLHFLQYGVLGGAVSVFFLVLLAVSEHLGFALAYGAAAGIVVILTTLYSMAVLERRRRAFWVFSALSALYGVFFLLVNLEDFALLGGTGLVVGALALAMFVTRRLKGHSATPSQAVLEGA